jgi:hypothetical protein
VCFTPRISRGSLSLSLFRLVLSKVRKLIDATVNCRPTSSSRKCRPRSGCRF